MSIIFVGHRFEGKAEDIARAMKITRELQISDVDNCYICPSIALMHLRKGEIDSHAEMELKKDLLMLCDKMIVASSVTPELQEQIELAKRCHLEVKYLERD